MSKMTKLKVVLFYLSLGMATAAVAGKTLFPGMQPIAEGALEYVDLKANELVLDDTTYQLAEKTLVRTRSGGFSSLDSLQVGRKVRFYSDPVSLKGAGGPTYVRGIELR